MKHIKKVKVEKIDMPLYLWGPTVTFGDRMPVGPHEFEGTPRHQGRGPHQNTPTTHPITNNHPDPKEGQKQSSG